MAKHSSKEESKEKEDEADTTVEIKEENLRPDYEELIERVSIISKPLASRKLTKKLYKTVKKGNVCFV